MRDRVSNEMEWSTECRAPNALVITSHISKYTLYILRTYTMLRFSEVLLFIPTAYIDDYYIGRYTYQLRRDLDHAGTVPLHSQISQKRVYSQLHAWHVRVLLRREADMNSIKCPLGVGKVYIFPHDASYWRSWSYILGCRWLRRYQYFAVCLHKLLDKQGCRWFGTSYRTWGDAV